MILRKILSNCTKMGNISKFSGYSGSGDATSNIPSPFNKYHYSLDTLKGEKDEVEVVNWHMKE
jgi:hypothetical protein